MINKEIQTNTELWKIIKESEVTVEFIKKDKTKREMKCTLDFDKIPKKDYPKSDIKEIDTLEKMKAKKILAMYDLEKQGWRSIPIDRLNWLKCNDIQYFINIKFED